MEVPSMNFHYFYMYFIFNEVNSKPYCLIIKMIAKYREKANQLLEQYGSKFTPEYIKQAQFQLGIDEAGRGPVFGSMIYSALWWPVELKEQLGSLGFNDSKVLTEQSRDQLLEIIDLLKGKLVFYETNQLTAEYISTCMNNKKHHTNLNQISHNAALELSRGALKKGFKVVKIIADTVGDPAKYADYLRNNLSQYSHIIKEVIVQAKADRDHKVVSASSICAKVTRDRIIKDWTFKENLQFRGELGSGYPGDPKTKEWLQKNKDPVFGYPNIVRFSWNTTVNALQGTLKLVANNDDDEDEEKLVTGFNLFKQAKDLHKDIGAIIKN